jgi:hypothetical protein
MRPWKRIVLLQGRGRKRVRSPPHTVLPHFSENGHAALEKNSVIARQRKESVQENLRKKTNVEIFCLPGK